MHDALRVIYGVVTSRFLSGVSSYDVTSIIRSSIRRSIRLTLSEEDHHSTSSTELEPLVS